MRLHGARQKLIDRSFHTIRMITIAIRSVAIRLMVIVLSACSMQQRIQPRSKTPSDAVLCTESVVRRPVRGNRPKG